MQTTDPGRETQILHDCVELLARECHPECIYLFGSRATQRAAPTSDFDFAVDGPAPTAAEQARVRSLMEALAGLYSINLVFLQQVDAEFRAIIMDSGQVVYERP